MAKDVIGEMLVTNQNWFIHNDWSSTNLGDTVRVEIRVEVSANRIALSKRFLLN